ncbi:MAG: ankyrin repeat domain-containing protein [Puniceicoccales bacterium]|jgi:ankyrin repeat protein|nr:ankyrin repeat domain-containing protein [Puniceicoccales bacterium]
MKKLNTKNIIKYVTVGGCLLSMGRLYGTLPWEDSNGGPATIDANIVDVNLQNKFKETPLHTAAKVGDLEAVRILINRGAVIDARSIDGCTPLHYAAINGHLEVARFLIEEKGAAIDVQDSVGMRPLDWAVVNGRLEVARFLIAKGADVDARNADGMRPLHWAALGGRLEVARFLIEEKKADVNALDHKGRTPLDCARNKVTEDFLRSVRSAGGENRR